MLIALLLCFVVSIKFTSVAQRQSCDCLSTNEHNPELEQLERLRSEDTPRCFMITHSIESCWIPSQNKVE